MIARLLIAAAVALLSGCAATGTHRDGETIPVRWVQLDEQELQETCRAREDQLVMPARASSVWSMAMTRSYRRNDITVNGCFDWSGGACVIYTRRASTETVNHPRFQQTIGHELLHCYRGYFHS